MVELSLELTKAQMEAQPHCPQDSGSDEACQSHPIARMGDSVRDLRPVVKQEDDQQRHGHSTEEPRGVLLDVLRGVQPELPILVEPPQERLPAQQGLAVGIRQA